MNKHENFSEGKESDNPLCQFGKIRLSVHKNYLPTNHWRDNRNSSLFTIWKALSLGDKKISETEDDVN